MARPHKKIEDRRIRCSFRINKNLTSLLSTHTEKHNIIRSRLVDELLKQYIEKNKNKL